MGVRLPPGTNKTNCRAVVIARKTGQLIARGSRTRLVRIALDRGLETGTRKSTHSVRPSVIEVQLNKLKRCVLVMKSFPRSQLNGDRKPVVCVEEKLLLSRHEAAQLLSISQRALDYLVATRCLPTIWN